MCSLQQRSIKSLDFSSPFLYSLLVYSFFFWLFFLSIIARPKNTFWENKEQRKTAAATSVCVCVYARGLTLRLKEPKQVQVSSIITKNWDNNWLSEPCLCMSNPYLDASQYSTSSALWISKMCQCLIFEVWDLYFYFLLKRNETSHFQLELYCQNIRHFTAPHLFQFIPSILVLYVLLLLEMTQMKKIWCKVLAGCCCITAGIRRSCCHVWTRSFKTLKSTVISTLLRI